MKTIGLIPVLVVCTLAADYDGVLFPSRQVVLSTLSTGVAIDIPYREGQSVSAGRILFAQDARKDSLNLVLAKRRAERSEIEKTNEVENEIAVRLQEIACQEKQVRAPFTGTIIKVLAKEKEYYPAGAKVIEFADASSLITEIHVPPNELSYLLTKKADISVYKGKDAVSGAYYSHNPLAEPGLAHNFLVKIIFQNRFKWAPGTPVKIRF